MTLLTRRTVIAARTEATAYVRESLVNADSNFNVMDVVAVANIEQQERQAADGFSNRASTTGLRSGTVTFKQDLHGDGAGGVPAWASTFLPACAIVDVDDDGVFRPVTDTPFEADTVGVVRPDRGVRTLTIDVYEHGRRKTISGAMGNAKFVHPTGKNSYVEFTFQGSWQEVEDATILTPTYPPQLPLRFAAASLDIGGFTPCVAELSFDMGNKVELRECQKNSNASGYRGAFVGDRKIGGALDPEAQLVGTYDAYGDWLNSVERAMVVELEDDVDKVTFGVPRFQINNMATVIERD